MNTLYPRILFISANASLNGTRRLYYDLYKCFKAYGCKVDLLLKDEADIPEDHIFFISRGKYGKKNSKQDSTIKRLIKKAKAFAHRIMHKKNYFFFYEDEDHPPFDPMLIVDKIEQKYDLVIITNWEDFIGAKVIEMIYDKLHVPIFLFPPDFCAITGGCHYFYDCDQYINGCKKCPGSHGKSFPHYNALERKRIWNKTNLLMFGNDFTANIYKKSFIYENKNVLKLFPPIDETLFCERDRKALRKILQIDDSVKYIISFGAQSFKDTRKGMSYLIKSLNILHSKIEDENSIILLAAGNADSINNKTIPFKCIKMGYLTMEQLAEMYAVSDIFLSPSIEDAGPMMVNQSLSCGTPVVAFEIGTALSVIKDQGTGYVAKNKDANDFAKGILSILSLSEEEYGIMRRKCREKALETTSFKAAAEPIINAYRNMDLTIFK